MLSALCAATAVTLVALAFAPQRRALSATQELARTSTLDAREMAIERSTQAAIWMRLLLPVLQLLADRVHGRWAGMSADDLRRAGFDTGRTTVQDIAAIKMLGAITGCLGVLCLSLVLPGILILLPAASFGGYVAPSIVIRRRRQARQAQMLRDLPDLVALLKAFVTSGTTLEQALHLISAQQAAAGDNLLAQEIRHALSDYGLGLALDEALGVMAERTGVEELEMLAAALAQGKRQGAGMERILRDQESVVRMGQRNRLTAQASRVGTRLVGVLVTIYLPEFMLLIMVPLFYGIFLRAFS